MTKETLVGRPAGAAPFIAAVFGAFPTLAMLACAAPTGNSWRWRGMQIDIVIVCAVAALSCVRKRSLSVLVMAPVLVLLWRLGKEWWALSNFNALDHFNQSASVIFDDICGALTTWVTVGLFMSLAWLAMRRRAGLADANDRNLLRLAAWLAAVGVVGVWQSLANDGWYTLENLKGDGTYVSHSSWPDTQIISLTLSLTTLIGATVMAANARGRRAARRGFVDAPGAGWKLAKHDAQVPPLLDPPTDRGLVLLEVEATAGGYREGGLERPVARV